MRTPDRGSTTGAASWTDRERSKRAAPQGRAKRVNPPPHRHIRDESSYESTGFFLLYSPYGGMRTPDRGSTTGAASWTDQRAAPTKTPGAFLNNACVGPEGARPMDGPSNGERSESIPPLTAIFEKRARTKVRALFASGPCKLSRGRHKCLARATHPAGRTTSSPSRRSAAGKKSMS